MIHLEKLEIFSRYSGDGDMFVRAAKEREKKFMHDDDWYLIDTLLQDAIVIDLQLGSEERTAQAIDRVHANCEGDDVVKRLHSLAHKLARPPRKFLWWNW